MSQTDEVNRLFQAMEQIPFPNETIQHLHPDLVETWTVIGCCDAFDLIEAAVSSENQSAVGVETTVPTCCKSLKSLLWRSQHVRRVWFLGR